MLALLREAIGDDGCARIAGQLLIDISYFLNGRHGRNVSIAAKHRNAAGHIQSFQQRNDSSIRGERLQYGVDFARFARTDNEMAILGKRHLSGIRHCHR